MSLKSAELGINGFKNSHNSSQVRFVRKLSQLQLPYNFIMYGKGYMVTGNKIHSRLTCVPERLHPIPFGCFQPFCQVYSKIKTIVLDNIN